MVARAALSAGPDGFGGKDASEISRNRRIASMRLGSTPASARPGAQACCAPSRRCWSRARFGTDSLARTSRRLWRSAVALSAHVRRRFDFHWRRALLPADGCSCFYAARYRGAAHLDDITEGDVVAAAALPAMTPRVLVMIPTFNEQQHRRPVTDIRLGVPGSRHSSSTTRARRDRRPGPVPRDRLACGCAGRPAARSCRAGRLSPRLSSARPI